MWILRGPFVVTSPSSLFRLCAMCELGAHPSLGLLPGILQPTTSRRLQQLMVCRTLALALSVRLLLICFVPLFRCTTDFVEMSVTLADVDKVHEALRPSGLRGMIARIAAANGLRGTIQLTQVARGFRDIGVPEAGHRTFSCWCRARLRVWLCWWMLWSKLRYALYLRVGCVAVGC